MNKTILNQNYKNKIISLYNRVFEKNSDINYWNWRFEKNPFGKLIIRFLLKNNEIASTYIVHPINIEKNNKIESGLFSMWTVTSPSFQKKGLSTLLANEVYKMGDGKFVIAFSNENSHHMFVKKLGFKSLGTMKEMVLELPTKIIKSNSIKCEKIESFDEEFSKFYNKQKNIIKKIMIPRTEKYLNWRFIKNPEVKYHCYKLLKDDKLLGYFILKNYQNEKCHIIDFLLENDSLIYEEMIYNTINFCKKNHLTKITLWTNGLESFHSQITKIGFKDIPMENNFVVKIFEENSLTELNYFENWYLTMSDSDVF